MREGELAIDAIVAIGPALVHGTATDDRAF